MSPTTDDHPAIRAGAKILALDEVRSAVKNAVHHGWRPGPGEVLRLIVEAIHEVGRDKGDDFNPTELARVEATLSSLDQMWETAKKARAEGQLPVVPDPEHLDHLLMQKELDKANAFRVRVRLWAEEQITKLGVAGTKLGVPGPAPETRRHDDDEWSEGLLERIGKRVEAVFEHAKELEVEVVSSRNLHDPKVMRIAEKLVEVGAMPADDLVALGLFALGETLGRIDENSTRRANGEAVAYQAPSEHEHARKLFEHLKSRGAL